MHLGGYTIQDRDPQSPLVDVALRFAFTNREIAEIVHSTPELAELVIAEALRRQLPDTTADSTRDTASATSPTEAS